jgi:hypothetical protein
MPGGGATPGADIPGGATKNQSGSKDERRAAYAFLLQGPYLAAHFDRESSRTPGAVHKQDSLAEWLDAIS